MSTTVWIVLAVANIPLYFGLGWVFFKDWSEFGEAIAELFTPRIVSAYRRDFRDNSWAVIKLALWAVFCVLCVLGEARLVAKW